jgi:HK97 family phage major capsid protein
MDENEKQELLNLIKAEMTPAIKTQLEEQFKDYATKYNPAPSKEEAEINKAAAEKKFKSFGEFLLAVHKFRTSGQVDNRLIYIDSNRKISPLEKALSEGTDSAGGFLVEQIYQRELLKIGLERSIIRPNGAMVVPMVSDSLAYPRVDDTSHASTVFGGVVAYWTSEAATMTASQPAFGQTILNAHELTGYTQASNVLLADSAISLEPFLKRAFGEAWAWYEDVAFIRGTGSGQPLGILNSGALASVTRQDTNYVCVKDILNLYSRMLPGGHDRAIWVMNHECFPALLYTIMENVETGSTSAAAATPMFLRNIVDPVAKTILGRPYFLTEKMSALGDAGDIGFFDLSYYLIGDRQAITIDVSTHVAFTSNQTAWRFVLRCDGKPWMASPITPYKGSATLSPFVTLSATS